MNDFEETFNYVSSADSNINAIHAPLIRVHIPGIALRHLGWTHEMARKKIRELIFNNGGERQ